MPDKNQEWNVSSTLLSTTMLRKQYFSFIIYISDGMLRTPLLTFSVLPTPNLQVLVTTFSGRTLSVIVNPFDTIEQLRYKVAIKEDISQDQIMLMKNGTILTDGDTLEYWDIRDQSLIYMTFRLRGG